jgi:hypothetical protein
MEFIGIHIAYAPSAWFWITLLNFDWKDQSRSFLHIEKNNSVWKFQFLWLSNDCWFIG